MCGRYTLRTPLTDLAEQFLFDLGEVPGKVRPRFNIPPTTEVLAVRQPEQGVLGKCRASRTYAQPS